MAVLMEDSAAVAGVFLATTSILLTHFTGSVVYDAVGSITIGGMVCMSVCVCVYVHTYYVYMIEECPVCMCVWSVSVFICGSCASFCL